MKVSFYCTASGRSPVAKFILGLGKPDQGRFADVHAGIEAHGLEFQEVEYRHLRGKLWELKFRASDGSYRILYVTVAADHMVWLHAIKKDGQKTPAEDFALALRRMKEIS
jgi:phage-related protein